MRQARRCSPVEPFRSLCEDITSKILSKQYTENLKPNNAIINVPSFMNIKTLQMHPSCFLHRLLERISSQKKCESVTFKELWQFTAHVHLLF